MAEEVRYALKAVREELAISAALEPEKIIRSDPALLCVSIYRSWRPVKLVLTDRRLLCQQAARVLLSISLQSPLRIGVMKTKVMLGKNRDVLVIEAGKAKQIICVKDPVEWRNSILQSASRLQGEANKNEEQASSS